MRWNAYKLTSGALSLVGQLGSDYSPCLLQHGTIQTALAKTSRCGHVRYLQILNDQIRRIFPDDFRRHTMDGIATANGDAARFFRKQRLCFLTTVAAFLCAGHLALQPFAARVVVLERAVLHLVRQRLQTI